ncbi:MAG: hypothetical protein K6D96_02600 [Acetatifactor sp.]|nr:hypothetical protein [Acetatifactor sp.]
MKAIKKMMALMLSVILCVSVTGCGSKTKQAVIGTWESTFDLSNEVGEDYLEYVGDIGFFMDFQLTFAEDGTCVMTVGIKDAEDYKAKAYEHATNYFRSAVEDELQKACDESGITLEELYAAYEVADLDEYLTEVADVSIDELVNNEITSTIDGAVKMCEDEGFTGTYTVAGDTVSISRDGELYQTCTYNAEADTLILYAEKGEDEAFATEDALTMTRVQ